MSDLFQIGVVVQLKSGGPAMTVEYIADDDEIGCVWAAKNGKVERDQFPLLALKHNTEGSDMTLIIEGYTDTEESN